LDTRKNDLEKEVDEYRVKYEEIQQKLVDVENSEKVLKIELEAKIQDIKKATQDLNDSKAETDTLKAKLLESEREYIEFKNTSSAQLKSLEDKLEAETKELQSQVDQLNNVKQSLEQAEVRLTGFMYFIELCALVIIKIFDFL